VFCNNIVIYSVNNTTIYIGNSHKYEHMQKKLDDLQEESKKVGLQINP
jgi:hypothetical protein